MQAAANARSALDAAGVAADETITLHYLSVVDGQGSGGGAENTAESQVLFGDAGGEGRDVEVRLEHCQEDDGGRHEQCPHRALKVILHFHYEQTLCLKFNNVETFVQELPHASLSEMARGRLRLATMQAQLSYVMLGLLGEKRMFSLGYPERRNAVGVLHLVLGMARTKVRL
jgi:hypothetical protein